MKNSLLVAALVALTLTACGKKEEAPAPTAPAAAPAAPAPEAAAPAAPAAAAKLGLGREALPEPVPVQW